MPPRKKLMRKDVIRLSRQKLWTDIGKALATYEKRVYGERALYGKHAQTAAQMFGAVSKILEPTVTKIIEQGKTEIETVDEIAAILPPEPPTKHAHARKPKSLVSDYVRGEEVTTDVAAPPNPQGLGSSEEKVLILIAQSHGGMTPAQIALRVALRRRSIQNILTSLKSQRFIIKDANHGKFRATEEGRTAVAHWNIYVEKGAILAELSESDRKVLFAIASKKEGVTVSAISVMVPGIKKRTKQNIITALKTRELIEKSGDRFVLTEHAREELKGKLEKPLTGKALREKLISSLPKPQAAVLDWLSYDGGRTATAIELAEALDYAPRTVQNIFTALKAQDFVVKHYGRFQLAHALRDDK